MIDESLVRDPHQDGEPVTSLTRKQAQDFLDLREQPRIAILLEMTETQRASIVTSLARALGPASPTDLASLDRFSEEERALAA